MQNSANLRKQARYLLAEANKEAEPHLRRRLVSYALALAQLAERLERGNGGRSAA
jgi:hypothetical protein